MNIDKQEINYRKKYFRSKKKIIFSKKIISRILIYSILLFWLFLCIFPFIWAIIASFNKYTNINNIGINPMPKEFTNDNYSFLFNNDLASENIRIWFKNSFIYSGISAGLNVVFNMMAGYALARIRFKGKKIIFWYLLAGTMIPAQVTQIPQLLILIKMNVIGSGVSDSRFFAGIIFSGMTSATWIFMSRQFYINQSKTIEEAARVDGLSVTKMFFKISLRQMIPIMATMFTMVFMASWNNFIMFVLWSGGNPERMTLVAGLQVIGDSAFSIAPQFSKSVTLAATNLVVIPVIVIYLLSLWFQKKDFVEGEK